MVGKRDSSVCLFAKIADFAPSVGSFGALDWEMVEGVEGGEVVRAYLGDARFFFNTEVRRGIDRGTQSVFGG